MSRTVEHPASVDPMAAADRAAASAYRRTRRAVLVTVILSVLAATAYFLLLGYGPVPLSPLEVFDVLTGGGDQRAVAVVWDLRLPEAVASVIIGAALGMAGAWTQTMARNPLASPDILGVSGGAAVCVVAGTVLAQPAFAAYIPGFWWRALLALVGAVIVVVLLFLLGGVGTGNRVVLVGLALSLLSQSLVHYLVVKADLTRAAEAQMWLAGSTGFIRPEALPPLLLALLPFVALGLWCQRDLRLLAHDDATSLSLGVHVTRIRMLLLIAATGVVAVVVSVAGPIGFIALVAPQIARLAARAPTPQAIPSAAAGAAMLTLCNVLAGLLPFTAPVGLVAAILGGPILVWLVWKESQKFRRDRPRK